MNDDRFMTVNELARDLGLTSHQVRRLCFEMQVTISLDKVDQVWFMREYKKRSDND